MLFNLVALATLAVVASVSPTPANALSVESHNFVRNGHVARHHSVLAKRQTSRPRRCRARTPVDGATTSNSSTSSPSTPGSTSTRSSSGAAEPTKAPATSNQPPATSKPPATSSKPPVTSSNPPPTTAKPTSTSNTTTKKPSSTAAPPAAPSWAGAKKACIAYAGNVNVPKFIAGSSKVSCIINWSSWKPTWMNQLNGVEFVPMYWGPKQNNDFQKNVVPGFAKYVLGMNEPNQEGQSLMSPGQGVGYWKQYIQPLKWQGYTLVSPACTNAPSGLTWLRDFINACDGCTVDHIATHWYGTEADHFIEHLKTYHNAFGRPIWVTEYACQDFSGRNQQCGRDKTFAFMEKTQNFLDNTEWIFRYAYFGALQYAQLGGVDPVNRLIKDDSSPSDLGASYLW